jgi:hypothetical protein
MAWALHAVLGCPDYEYRAAERPQAVADLNHLAAAGVSRVTCEVVAPPSAQEVPGAGCNAWPEAARALGAPISKPATTVSTSKGNRESLALCLIGKHLLPSPPERRQGGDLGSTMPTASPVLPGTADTLRPRRRNAHPADPLVYAAGVLRQSTTSRPRPARGQRQEPAAVPLRDPAVPSRRRHRRKGRPPGSWPICWLTAVTWTGYTPGPTRATGTPSSGWPICWPNAATWMPPCGWPSCWMTAAARAGCAHSSRTSGAPAPGWPGCWAVAATLDAVAQILRARGRRRRRGPPPGRCVHGTRGKPRTRVPAVVVRVSRRGGRALAAEFGISDVSACAAVHRKTGHA